MQSEVCSKAYRYKVFSGVRIVVITLTKNIPSHKMIAGQWDSIMWRTAHDLLWLWWNGTFQPGLPQEVKLAVETTNEPTVSFSDIAVSGNNCPRSDGQLEEEADRIQAGYGVEDSEFIEQFQKNKKNEIIGYRGNVART